MRYEMWVAMRNLRTGRKRRLARVTAVVAVTGIAVGVGALIIALSLANGFRDEMRDKILRGTAHLNVMKADGQPITNYRNLVAQIGETEGVLNASPTTYEGAVLVGPKSSNYAVLRGLDRQNPVSRQELNSIVVEGAGDPLFEPKEGDLREVVLGTELAARAGVRVGEVVELISANRNAASAEPTRRLVRVCGLFRSGLYEYDNTWIYVAIELANVLTGNTDQASVISVQVDDIYDVGEVAEKVRSNLGAGYTTLDWQQANRPLFAALALERRMGLLIIGLIIFIAALNIMTTLVLMVSERRKEIAILTAMGATARSITTVFLMEGLVIGGIGAVLGALLGLIGTTAGNYFEVISLPADVYSLNNVPFNVYAVDVIIAAVVALLLSLIATIYPARAAAKVRPVEMLRDVP